MKIRFLANTALLLLSFVGLSYAQNEVKFRLKAPEKAEAGSTLRTTVTAEVQEGWHLYSLSQPPGGPFPTKIVLEKNEIFAQDGAVKQPPVLTWFDKNFGIETEYFEDKADFEIPIKINASAPAGKHSLPVKVTYQVCSDSLCLPPQTRQLKVEVEVKSAQEGSAVESTPPPPAISAPVRITETAEKSAESNQSAALEPSGGGSPIASEPRASASGRRPLPDGRAAPAGGQGSETADGIPLATMAYIWFAGAMGALALLTPCVFPMIPITVSYFTKRESNKKRAVAEAGLYSAGIILTFTLIGFALTLLFGVGGINRLAANPVINLTIASIFIVFGLSLFGVLELGLPSSWINAINRRSSGSGILGIMFMALTFSLTSFTCTVPFVGTVMVAATQGDWMWSLMGVTVFAAVFSAPFFLLAMFPSWLQSLPRSGNWMNSIKITMGFLELAAALKFLSNVDLVYQWQILTRPVFITLWLAIALVTALYLLGKFYFPHEAPSPSVGAMRVLSAIFFLAISFYLLRGLFGFPLGELDAFLPPRDYGNPASISWVAGNSSENEEEVWVTNYQAALVQAQRENRPLFIDFTGYTCTNCRWMEANIFTLPDVRQLMRQFVLVRLYTDGTQPKHKENLQFEQTRFGTIALPLYALLSPQDQIIATFPGLTRNKNEFITFLQKGLSPPTLTAAGTAAEALAKARVVGGTLSVNR